MQTFGAVARGGNLPLCAANNACDASRMMPTKIITVAFAAWVVMTSAAYARPCDAVQKSSGNFTAGRPFDGEVVEIVDPETVRIVPVGQKATSQNWCDVDLVMFGTRSPPTASSQRQFLGDFALHRQLFCMPQPSNRSRAGGQMLVTIWRGERVSASCEISYPLDELLRKTAKARR